MAAHLGTAFHQTFKLERPRLIEVLRYVQSTPNPSDTSSGFVEELGKHTSLGSNMCKSFPQYGIGSGLLERDTIAGRQWSSLTPFGEAAMTHDPAFQAVPTQWLMHHHLSGENGPGPLFWHIFFSGHFKPSIRFSKDFAEDAVKEAGAREGKSEISSKTIGSTVTAFLGSYLPGGGLDRLGLIHRVVDDEKRFEGAFFPEPLPCAAFGYVLVDHWSRVWGDKVTVNLDALLVPQGLATILMLTHQTVETYLTQLRRDGLIDLFRVAPPYQVVRAWSDPIEAKTRLLARMYGVEPR